MSDEADLMSIGRHCTHEFCGQVDFLPFTCDCCKLVYCLEHRSYAAHACKKAAGKTTEVIVCPVCAKAIRMVPGEDANVTFQRHTTSGCDPSNYAKVHRKPKCPAPGCREKLTSINTYTCKSCSTKVCLKHRLPDDHKCSAQQGKPLAAALSRQQGAGVVGRNVLSSWLAPTPAAAPKAAPQPRPQDPANTVRGSAARRQPPQASPAPAPGAPALASAAGSAEVCQQCGARFGDVASLIVHCEEYHPAAGGAGRAPPSSSSGGEFRCTKCGQHFSDAVQLVAHDEAVHAARRPQRTSDCVVC